MSIEQKHIWRWDGSFLSDDTWGGLCHSYAKIIKSLKFILFLRIEHVSSQSKGADRDNLALYVMGSTVLNFYLWKFTIFIQIFLNDSARFPL